MRVVGMVGAAIIFFPAAPSLLFIHGKDITIPKGTEVTAFVAGDMMLDMAKFAPQPEPRALVVAAVAVPAGPLTVEASVAGADIEVDETSWATRLRRCRLRPGSTRLW
jgi:hypothetical protein